jgi:hypothetical protein
MKIENKNIKANSIPAAVAGAEMVCPALRVSSYPGGFFNPKN